MVAIRRGKSKNKIQPALTKLAELTVGDQQSPESAQALKGLVSVLLRSLLINGRTRHRNGLGIELLSLPDEILQQVSLVLGQEKFLGLVDNIANVANKRLSFGGELVRRPRQGRGREETVQGDVDLIVLPRVRKSLTHDQT